MNLSNKEKVKTAYENFLNGLLNMNYSTDLKDKKEDTSNKLKTTNLNIYEARTLLKNMPVGTKMKMYIGDKKREYIVRLDDSLNLEFNRNIKDETDNTVFSSFGDETILFATFDLIEEKKEEWVDCDIKTALEYNIYCIKRQVE